MDFRHRLLKHAVCRMGSMGKLEEGIDAATAIFIAAIVLIVGWVLGDAVWNALSPTMSQAVTSAQNATGPGAASNLLGLVVPLIAVILLVGGIIEVYAFLDDS